MTIFDKEFEEMYPEILETLKIICEPYAGKGKFTIFTTKTQHFGVDHLSELTEENILNHIHTGSWFNKNYEEKKQNSLRRIRLEKIL